MMVHQDDSCHWWKMRVHSYSSFFFGKIFQATDIGLSSFGLSSFRVICSIMSYFFVSPPLSSNSSTSTPSSSSSSSSLSSSSSSPSPLYLEWESSRSLTGALLLKQL